MRTFFFTIIIFFVLAGCSLRNRDDVRNCADQGFTSIDSALKCGDDPKDYKSLLFAIVSKDVEKYRRLGWNILEDQDIISVAKRDYVLIICDPSQINLTNQTIAEEFLDIVKQPRQAPYFVVTNRVFYPFREFDLSVDKEQIISDLRLGEGP